MNNGWSFWYSIKKLLTLQWKLLAIFTVFGAVIGGGLALRQSTTFTARSEIVTGTYSLPVDIGTQSVVDKAGPLGLELPAETQARIIASPSISALAADALQLGTKEEADLAASVQASPTTDNSFAISAAGSTAKNAAVNANAIANAYLKYRTDVGRSELNRLAQQAKGQAASSTAAAKAMDKSIASALDKNPNYASTLLTRQQDLERSADSATVNANSLTAMALSFTGGGSVLRPATAGTSSESTGLLIYLVTGLLAGAALGIVAASVRRQVSDRVLDRQDVIRATGISAVFAGPSTVWAGGPGQLVLRSLEKACSDHGLSRNQVLVQSLSEGSGRIMAALMIARAESEQGRSLAIAGVDDATSAEILEAHTALEGHGFLLSELTGDSRDTIRETVQDQAGSVFGTVLHTDVYDLVLLIAKPRTVANEQSNILPIDFNGAVVLVAQAGEDRAQDLQNAVEEFEAAALTVAAVILLAKSGRRAKSRPLTGRRPISTRSKPKRVHRRRTTSSQELTFPQNGTEDARVLTLFQEESATTGLPK